MSHTPYTLGRDTVYQQLGLTKVAGGIFSTALRESSEDFIDLSTGAAPSPEELVLKRLGVADFPNIVPVTALEQLGNQALTANPSLLPPIKTSAWRFKLSTTGMMNEEPPRESPEYHLAPRRHHPLLSDPGFGESTVPSGGLTNSGDPANTPIPGDNEAPDRGGGGGGGGPPMSRSGAEVPVPDQTPQRQAMSLYDMGGNESEVGGIFNHFDQRIQNPASNSITRFVTE